MSVETACIRIPRCPKFAQPLTGSTAPPMRKALATPASYDISSSPRPRRSPTLHREKVSVHPILLRFGGIQVQVARHRITLSTERPPQAHGHGGRAAYGFVVEVCRGFAPALARTIHDGEGLKPLSVSPVTVDDARVVFSCATLDADGTAGLAAALEEARETRRTLAIAGAEARID